MEKMAKYKKKYNEVSSVKDLKNNVRNPMKEKRFIERLRPGLNLQVLKKGGDILLDFNPYLGYRLTSRFTLGAGWNHRIAFNWHDKNFQPNASIFGPRLYTEYTLKKGFSPRLELETMNTMVPPATVKHGDPFKRVWVAGAFAGIKKVYKIAGPLHGTASVMFRLFDPKRQSPYGDVVNARFGFEYSIKSKAGEKSKVDPRK